MRDLSAELGENLLFSPLPGFFQISWKQALECKLQMKYKSCFMNISYADFLGDVPNEKKLDVNWNDRLKDAIDYLRAHRQNLGDCFGSDLSILRSFPHTYVYFQLNY